LEDVEFPPVVVFNDGANYWLVDGFHRWHANKKAGFLDIECEIHDGTRRDAVLWSVGANASHGLRRTNDDKRKAVLTLLEDLEWSEWSDSEIGRRCNVSHTFVSRIKKSMGLEQAEKKYTTKHGTTAKMKPANKPSEPVVMKPAEVPQEDERLAELAAAHEDLAEENARLLAKLAIQNMEATAEEKQAAHDTIESLQAQVKTLEAELRAVKNSRDQLQQKNADMLKQVNYWKKRCDKLESGNATKAA
jgi:vacuolar-type H+-ATPase subunit I/STV1